MVKQEKEGIDKKAYLVAWFHRLYAAGQRVLYSNIKVVIARNASVALVLVPPACKTLASSLGITTVELEAPSLAISIVGPRNVCISALSAPEY